MENKRPHTDGPEVDAAAATERPAAKRFKPPQVVSIKTMAAATHSSTAEVEATVAVAGTRRPPPLGLRRPKKAAALHPPTEPGAIVLHCPPLAQRDDGRAEVHVVVDPRLQRVLRPHQVEGVTFMYGCLAGWKEEPRGCILADGMGLGKTLQSVALVWTLLRQSPSGHPAASNALVLAPSSLVSNWAHEFSKWLGPSAVATFPVAASTKDAVTRTIERFQRCPARQCPVLIMSYEGFRAHLDTVLRGRRIDLVVCDEAHRLKNPASGLTAAVSSLETRRRLVLTGTPVQNDLEEFYTLVSFASPDLLGDRANFNRLYGRPILAAREPGCSDDEYRRGTAASARLSQLVSTVMLRRTSQMLEKYLPPKAEIVVFCGLSALQRKLYRKFLEDRNSREENGGRDDDVDDDEGGGRGALKRITSLVKLCNHPSLLHENMADHQRYDPSLSGKADFVCRLLDEVRRACRDTLVIVSNYTQTLDFLGEVFRRRRVTFVRLDGAVATAQRQKMVDQFNSPARPYDCLLLSSKAGGCGLNIVGANRLVMFDPDWNPATDLQAMARVWRDGQKKVVFIYRLFSTGTLEEKIFQRQLWKQGMAHEVMEKEHAADAATRDEGLEARPTGRRRRAQLEEERAVAGGGGGGRGDGDGDGDGDDDDDDYKKLAKKEAAGTDFLTPESPPPETSSSSSASTATTAGAAALLQRDDDVSGFGDFAEDDLKSLFVYNEDTLCDTQDKVKGSFTNWKRFRGVELVEDVCLQKAGSGIVTYLFVKYFNRDGLRERMRHGPQQQVPAPAPVLPPGDLPRPSALASDEDEEDQ